MTDPEQLAAGVIARLIERGETLATAESLTGGLLGALLTGIPGASLAYRGGLIVYATDLKATLAGVAEETLARDGAVAQSTAAELAAGAADRCGATWGLSATGVAGPDRQEGHPAGTVFVGLAGPDGPEVRRLSLSGDRAAIRGQTCVGALDLLLGRLTEIQRTSP
ncbi:CinA family protein [Microlunatus parietis]|uniref:Nicotinamide-nucleotide amidase n=1 Tax=Microlunatus parietis TaxID=682979 RepID=A0A7Y9I347_9ACTN|nr:CinA family protein [Microlunatus parietis]NYE69369.1 nicotinamide-nucleotide amidase [Microlunatus parietis]